MPDRKARADHPREHKSAPPVKAGGELGPQALWGPLDLTDEELIPYYNEYMRRKMQRRRKAK